MSQKRDMGTRLGVWRGHLLSLKIASRVLDDQQWAFVEGRESSHDLSEKLSD